jgi:Putative zinc-finger
MNVFKQLVGHLVSCKDATHLVSKMQDGQLTAVQRWKLKWHLAVCTMCMTFEKQMRFLREAMHRYRQ